MLGGGWGGGSVPSAGVTEGSNLAGLREMGKALSCFA